MIDFQGKALLRLGECRSRTPKCTNRSPAFFWVSLTRNRTPAALLYRVPNLAAKFGIKWCLIKNYGAQVSNGELRNLLAVTGKSCDLSLDVLFQKSLMAENSVAPALWRIANQTASSAASPEPTHVCTRLAARWRSIACLKTGEINFNTATPWRSILR